MHKGQAHKRPIDLNQFAKLLSKLSRSIHEVLSSVEG